MSNPLRDAERRMEDTLRGSDKVDRPGLQPQWSSSGKARRSWLPASEFKFTDDDVAVRKRATPRYEPVGDNEWARMSRYVVFYGCAGWPHSGGGARRLQGWVQERGGDWLNGNLTSDDTHALWEGPVDHALWPSKAHTIPSWSKALVPSHDVVPPPSPPQEPPETDSPGQ